MVSLGRAVFWWETARFIQSLVKSSAFTAADPSNPFPDSFQGGNGFWKTVPANEV